MRVVKKTVKNQGKYQLTETNECFKSGLYFKCSQAIVEKTLIKKPTDLLWSTGTHA